MATDPENSIVPPSETSGGDARDPEGIAPAEQAAPDAPPDTPEPVTEAGVHGSAGDGADATTDGADATTGGVANRPAEEGIDAMDPMQAVKDYSASKAV